MHDRTAHFEALADLEARHDHLLEELAQLDRRVARALAECQTDRGTAAAESAGQ